MAQPKKDIYRVIITRTHDKYWEGGEFKFPYKVTVTRLAFKTGKTWTDYDIALTRSGARRAVKKIIKRNNVKAFEPMKIEQYEIDA